MLKGCVKIERSLGEHIKHTCMGEVGEHTCLARFPPFVEHDMHNNFKCLHSFRVSMNRPIAEAQKKAHAARMRKDRVDRARDG